MKKKEYHVVVEVLFETKEKQRKKNFRETFDEKPTTKEITEIEAGYRKIYTDPYSVSEEDKGFYSATVVNIFKTLK